jgi:polysaccharide export outer membrane protein
VTDSGEAVPLKLPKLISSRIPVIIICLAVLQLLQACSTGKKINELTYFNQQGDSLLAKVVQNTEPVILPGDRLGIVVNAANPASVAPYNLAVAAIGPSASTNGGYLVEADSTIQLPQLGKVQVGGLKRKQLVDLLTARLVKYVNDPLVTIEFLNFKITVLGEVGHQGTFNIPDGRVTLLDAIGLAGDLPLTARREEVTVIREKNGKREFGKVNLLTKNAFSSPFYVLQQNDVVYVEPTKAKVASTDASFTKNFSIVTSVLSVLTTMTVLVTNAIN